MASLPQSERLKWLASIAARVRHLPPPPGDIIWQELREVARGCRLALTASIQVEHGPFDPAHILAILEVPRERFVRPEDMAQSADDTPLPLDDEGRATISAPHAYGLMFRLLALGIGDSVIELGTGSGYGAALASFIIGPHGRVSTFEIDPRLCLGARTALADDRIVSVICRDAVTSSSEWGQARKVCVTFAVDELPRQWIDALPEGGCLVAPVGRRADTQRLTLVRREGGRILRTDHGAVRYVRNRSGM
jgi:protein-L-isoaspartate(D-aspartate) O-methyltransferase